MTDYPAGTRLRVTVVGTVGDVGNLYVRTSPGSRWNLGGTILRHAERVEVLEPDWQSGDVVLDANGAVFLRRGDGAWLLPGHTGDFYSPVRPLTLLARDGKPATLPELDDDTEAP